MNPSAGDSEAPLQLPTAAVAGVSCVVPSRAFGDLLSQGLKQHALGINKLIIAENQLQMSYADAVASLAGDPATTVIAMVIHEIVDGEAFLRLASGAGKPLVVLKVGETDAAQRDLHAAVFQQVGAVVAPDSESFFDAIAALAAYAGSAPENNRVALIASSEGARVLASDACQRVGLALTELASESAVRAPHDVSSRIEEVAANDEVSGVLFMAADDDGLQFESMLASAAKRKPVIACLSPSSGSPKRTSGVPCFPSPERAVRAYKALLEYRQAAARPRQTRPAPDVQPMNIEGSGIMDEHEAKRLLDRWGVTVVPETLVVGPGRHEFVPIKKLAIHFGFPVALKAIRADIVYKSHMGAVALGLRDIDQLEAAWEEMHGRFPDAAWLIQPSLPGDMEVIVSAKRDPVFGPVVLFGSGGLLADLYDDVAIRVAPLSPQDALDMIDETRASAVMRGFHGLPKHDPHEVADVIVKVGDLMLGQPSVTELHLHPLLLTEKGPIVVDAKAIIA